MLIYFYYNKLARIAKAFMYIRGRYRVLIVSHKNYHFQSLSLISNQFHRTSFF